MAKAPATANIPLRVSFENAPLSVRKALIGVAKDRNLILSAVKYFSEQDGPNDAHEKEIFHYVNTDGEGKYYKDEETGEDVLPIGVQSLQKQLAILVKHGELVKEGERTGRYSLADGVEIGEDEDEDASEADADEDE